MSDSTGQVSKKDIVTALLDNYGETYAQELSVKLEKGTPAPLFQWLCACVLFSARISNDIAKDALRALKKSGWTTADKMAKSNWKDRVKTLNDAGYARFDERTATMLGDVANAMQEHYNGDLRKLRKAADRDPKQQRKLLKKFKGLGDTGVDIFMREVQAIWQEIAPFADKKALKAAGKLELADDAEQLAELVSDNNELAKLCTALVRLDFSGDYDELREKARNGGS